MASIRHPWRGGRQTQGYSSNGNRGQGGRSFHQPTTSSLPKPEGSQKKLLDIISAKTLSTKFKFDGNAQIENVQYVASFNWKESRDPSILVPGKFPLQVAFSFSL